MAANPNQSTAGSSGSQIGGNVDRIQPQSQAVTKVPELLDDSNWNVWKNRMAPILRVCDVVPYVAGKVPRPSDAKQASNWDYNDDYAKILIENNILSSQMIHTSQCTTACAMWDSLEAVHQSKGHEATIAIMRNLFHTIADNNTNITEHLATVKDA